MRTTSLALIACAAAIAATASTNAFSGQAVSAAAQRPAVHLQVAVREGSRAVSGLTAQDFVVADNDVPQTIEAVTAEGPIDVTLVVDTKSASATVAGRVGKDLEQIVRLLRNEDALRLIRLDSYVEELRPMSPVTGPVTVANLSASARWSSLHDALVAALVRPGAADRRQLVLCLTDGIDTMSLTTAVRVREVASRSAAVLQIVTVRPPTGGAAGVATSRPHHRDASALILSEAAEGTGGELRAPSLFSDADLVSAFTRAIEEFRQSYVVRYTPANVEPGGWHEVSVTVPRAENAVVRVRRGYHAN